MKYNFTYSASIEQYLSNEMNAADRARFEREISGNQKLFEELNLSRMIDEALMQDDVIDLRKKLVAVYKKSDQKQEEAPVVKMKIRTYWYAAASVIVLLGLSSLIYFSQPSMAPNDKLFHQYYSSENLIGATRNGETNLVEAVMKFQEKDFASSALLFQQLLARDKENYAAWFYYGISNIEIKNYALAEKSFTNIINNGTSLYVEHAEWYLALCYLKSDRLEKAVVQLYRIANSTDNYHRLDARHLLEKLRK